MKPLQQIVDALRTFTVVRKIILFGSRARKDNQPKSDFDIAIDCPDATSEDWIDLITAINQIPTLLSIQLIRLNGSSLELQQRIQEEGVVLYEQKN